MAITFQHRIKLKDLINFLKTDPERGLSKDEVLERLKKYGRNVLEEKAKKSEWRKFLEQFENTLIIILIITAIISFFIPDHRVDAVVIILVVFINAVMGYITEYKAEKALEKLKELSAPTCTVIRDGAECEVSSSDLVPGDVMLIKPGMTVPADARVITSTKILVDESHLTGESLPVRKEAKDILHEVPLAERVNMVYMGSKVTEGEGKSIVTSTGMSTELGQIAKMVTSMERDEQTPLQKSLDRLGNKLGLIAGVVAVAVFLVSIWRYPGEILDATLTGVSIAVAVIPEGLPVVVAITLTFGMQALAKKNAIMRRLGSVETLGATNVICTDKTGTLTKNEMTVREVYTSFDRGYDIKGAGYAPKGDILHNGKPVKAPSEEKDLVAVMAASALCTNANLIKPDHKWMVVGDPTEGALLTAALKTGMDKEFLYSVFPRLGEVVFDEERMRMSTVHYYRKDRSTGEVVTKYGDIEVGLDIRAVMEDLGVEDNSMVLAIKGAPAKIIKRCSYIYTENGVRKMTDEEKEHYLERNRAMAKKALRVLAVGIRVIPPQLEKEVYEDAVDDRTVDDKYLQEKIEDEIVFLGLVGMMDPPREGVKEAIKKANSAGIKVVMITGDQMETAKAIGRELGIYKKGDMAMSGPELDRLSDAEYMEVVDRITIYARASPTQKLRIVKALKARGYIVGMTGDGVNDAPALSQADIGIAMGHTGTDVAKEASEMILADDNFATIINAVEEGRKIYSNIKKFVKYQISTNVGAIFLIVTATLIGYRVPMIPVQILWVNLLMDGPPAVSLGFEPIHDDVMKQKPRAKDEPILSREMIMSILLLGIIMAAGTLLLYSRALDAYDLDKARTIAFTTFVFFQLINVLNCRSEKDSLITLKPFSNKYLILSVIVLSLLQVFIIYAPFMQVAFHTVPLTLRDWGFIISITLTIFVFDEFRKIYSREIKSEVG